MRASFKKHGRASYVSEEGERHVFKRRQVDHVLPHGVFPPATRRSGRVSAESRNKKGERGSEKTAQRERALLTVLATLGT